MDLERRFKLLQEEKQRTQQHSKQRCSLSSKKTDSSLMEMRRSEDTLANRERDLSELKGEIACSDTALSKKEEEVRRLRLDQVAYEESIEKLLREKRLLEDDLRSVEQGQIDAKRKAESLVVENERLDSERAMAGNRTRDVEEELIILRKKLEDEELRLEIARRGNMQREKELTAILGSRSYNNEEVTRIAAVNLRLQNDNKEIALRIADIEAQLAKTREHCDDGEIILGGKQKELAQVKSDAGHLEDRRLLLMGEVRKAREGNETLQRLLDKYREDTEFQKRLRDVEAARRVELQLEKRRLQSETLSKDMEVRSTRKELEQVRSSHEHLLENRQQIGDELIALKHHAELLEAQNMSLNSELERFVDTDAKVRKELNRKPAVSYLQSKNSAQLQQSLMKVRESTSPKRFYGGSAIKTDYTSSYRSPNNY
eukprot:TRINITY_DN5463_c0_g7_i2.p1 TRINITY_DN5463_c0_g7~~TRINITY_DN5463_c0_g7_i2.p1  ORF type:complete len:429 (-),score=114.25 TRINITY_DN5463_c0_g7_i2:103-1389(-)